MPGEPFPNARAIRMFIPKLAITKTPRPMMFCPVPARIVRRSRASSAWSGREASSASAVRKASSGVPKAAPVSRTEPCLTGIRRSRHREGTRTLIPRAVRPTTPRPAERPWRKRSERVNSSVRTRMTIMGLVVAAVAAGLAGAFITVLVLGPVVGATLPDRARRAGAARIRHLDRAVAPSVGAPPPVKSRWRCPETTCSPYAPDRPRAR